MLLILLNALSPQALAGVPEGDLVMTRLSVQDQTLSYALDSASWQGLLVRDAPATLAVFSGQELLWSAPLNNQMGNIQLPTPPSWGQPVSVQLISYRGAWMARSLNGQPKVQVRAARPRGNTQVSAPAHGHGHGQPQPVSQRGRFPIAPVIAACDSAFYSDSYELECVQAAKAAQINPVEMISACDETYYSEPDILRCVQDVATARVDISSLILACDDAFYDATNARRCVRASAAAAGQRYAPSPAQMRATILACDEASYSDMHQASCVEAAIGQYDAAALVRACDDAYYSQTDVLSCVQSNVAGKREEEWDVASCEIPGHHHERPTRH